MKKLLLLVMFFSFHFCFAQMETTTYYFIRHAEKVDNSRNPDLSDTGHKRAKEWSEIFSEIDLDAIYSTDYKRTCQTVAPTSKSKQLNIEIYDPKKIDIQNFKKNTVHKKVLIVGHSNTTPSLINQLIGKNVYKDIEDTIFGNLYIVTVCDTTINHQVLKLK